MYGLGKLQLALQHEVIHGRFWHFPIADPSKNFQRILTKIQFVTKFISLKVQRIHKILYNFEPEMENPAQRLQNLQMKY